MVDTTPTPAAEERRRVDLLVTTRRAVGLVWSTSRRLTLALAAGTLVAGLVPAAIAWVGKALIDAIVAASRGTQEASGLVPWLVAELVLVVVLAANGRLLGIARSLLRARLGNRVNVMI